MRRGEIERLVKNAEECRCPNKDCCDYLKYRECWTKYYVMCEWFEYYQQSQLYLNSISDDLPDLEQKDLNTKDAKRTYEVNTT